MANTMVRLEGPYGLSNGAMWKLLLQELEWERLSFTSQLLCPNMAVICKDKCAAFLRQDYRNNA